MCVLDQRISFLISRCHTKQIYAPHYGPLRNIHQQTTTQSYLYAGARLIGKQEGIEFYELLDKVSWNSIPRF